MKPISQRAASTSATQPAASSVISSAVSAVMAKVAGWGSAEAKPTRCGPTPSEPRTSHRIMPKTPNSADDVAQQQEVAEPAVHFPHGRGGAAAGALLSLSSMW